MPVEVARARAVAKAKAAVPLTPKAAVGYVYAPDASILCKECAFLTPAGRCTDHPGAEQLVSLAAGSCNDWQDLRQGRIAGNNSRPWVECGYLENQNGFGCRRCRHMNLEKEDCDAVDRSSPGATPGKIHAYGCCTLWRKDPKRGNWPESRFHA
jgi:hypothetical protein